MSLRTRLERLERSRSAGPICGYVEDEPLRDPYTGKAITRKRLSGAIPTGR